MSEYLNDIRILHEPSGIKNVQLASSPYVLRKIFAEDPVIRKLIEGGEKVVPLIMEETRKGAPAAEITLAAYAFIIENIKPEAAPEILGPIFKKTMKDPGPYFVHFAAHAIRSGRRMPVKPLEMVYSRAELIETQEALE